MISSHTARKSRCRSLGGGLILQALAIRRFIIAVRFQSLSRLFSSLLSVLYSLGPPVRINLLHIPSACRFVPQASSLSWNSRFQCSSQNAHARKSTKEAPTTLEDLGGICTQDTRCICVVHDFNGMSFLYKIQVSLQRHRPWSFPSTPLLNVFYSSIPDKPEDASPPDSSSRLCKRKRDGAPVSRIAEEEEPGSRLFFDLLPAETIENTTRLLSAVKNVREWSQGINPEDISSLGKETGY